MTQQRPVFLAETARVELVARALGIEARDILITGLPCEVISTGLPFHIVPLASLEAMGRIILRHRDADAIAHTLPRGDRAVSGGRLGG